MLDQSLYIDNKILESRLILGTGKYPSTQTAIQSIEESKTEMVTVAIRRLDKQNGSNQEKEILNSINWKKILFLPNTAGSKTAEDAIRMAFIGREFAKRINQEDNKFVKLEVIPDPKYLLPDPIGTIKAAKFLVQKGFSVLPYINADPILAQHLEDIGCCTLMPLGSPIGSGQGLKNLQNIEIILENANIPVIVDAGVKTPSQAAEIMELGVDAVLMNTAVAKSPNPILMAKGMQKAVKGGRYAYLSGTMKKKKYASASSPITGLFF